MCMTSMASIPQQSRQVLKGPWKESRASTVRMILDKVLWT
jgi:hypothetical protein